MKECPSCRRCYDDKSNFCPIDGIGLTISLSGPRLLGGKYRLERLIARGGMGAIYQAVQEELSRLIAIKVLNPEFVNNPTALERFRREALASANLKHPNIVTIYDFGVTPSGSSFIAMEFLKGRSLSVLLEQEGKLGLDRTLKIIEPICQALTEAHHKGIIHRDLKPDNIMLEQSGTNEVVKVVDFGLAKLKQRAEQRRITGNLVVGTFDYMSPEQCQSLDLDPTSDIYSLGVMLYEMLTGRVPFHSQSRLATIYQHINEPPRPPREFAPEIPHLVESVILKALAKDPRDRQQSSKELFEELVEASQDVSLASGISSRQQRLLEDTGKLIKPEAERKKINSALKKHLVFEYFLGREKELNRLTTEFAFISTGRCKPSIILGDAGVGKTQLINEFWKRLGKGAIFLNGRFFDYLGTTPYKPLLDTLTSQMQKLLTEDGQFDKVFGELSARAKQDLETNWQLWQSQKPNSGSLQGGPESEKYRTFEYLTQLYIKLAHHNPLILWMDDVQWADGLSLNFLAYLLRRTLGEPIQFIFTARKQDVTQKMHPFQQWLASVATSRNIEQIQLGGLSQVEIEQYLRSVFNEYEVAEEPDQKPPVGIVERLWQETQGNPYYISEILRLLVEEERIIWTGQRWRFERFDKITLPSSIVNIVDSHLRRFKDEELDVFMQAAVLGERFSFETLRLVTGLDEEKLVDIVETGLSGYVLKEEVNDKASGAPVLAAVDEVYSFYQTTVRKVLYSKLNTRRRRRTHQRVAESIEHYNADKVEQLSPLLAYHYFNGEQYHLAFKYTVQSAASAWSALAIEETEKYLSQIDEIIAHIEEIKELEKQFKSEDSSPDLLGNILVRPLAQYRILLGEFLMVRGQLSEAEKSLFIALKLSERIGEPSIAGRAIVATGELYKERNKIDRALKFFQHAYSVYQKTGYLSGECRALNRMAWVNYEKGDYNQAIDLSRRCITLAELGTDKLAKAEALLIISSTNYRTARYTTATEGAESVLLLAQSMNDRVLERQATELLGLVACTLGLYEQSLSWFDQALQIARDTGARRPEASLLIDIGEVYRQEGKFQEAIDYFSQAYEVARAVSAMREQKTALIDLGLVYKGLQYRDQAFGYLRQAWALSKEIIDPVLTVRESTGFAELYLMTNDYPDALRLSQQALELSKNIGLRGEVWQLLYIQGKIYRQTSEFEKASAVLEESINVLKAIAAEITDKPTRKTFLSDKSIVVELFNQVKNYKTVINTGTESRQD